MKEILISILKYFGLYEKEIRYIKTQHKAHKFLTPNEVIKIEETILLLNFDIKVKEIKQTYGISISTAKRVMRGEHRYSTQNYKDKRLQSPYYA